MNLSDQTVAIIRDGLAKGQDYELIARRAKCSEYAVRDFDVCFNKKFVVSEDGYGRPSLRPFIIASRHVDRDWDMRDGRIRRAREQYDAGEIDMAQGRDGFMIHIYAFPRKIVDRHRRRYFSRNFGEG